MPQREAENRGQQEKKHSWEKRQAEKKPYLSFRERYAEHAVDPEKSYRATKYLRPSIAEPSS